VILEFGVLHLWRRVGEEDQQCHGRRHKPPRGDLTCTHLPGFGGPAHGRAGRHGHPARAGAQQLPTRERGPGGDDGDELRMRIPATPVDGTGG